MEVGGSKGRSNCEGDSSKALRPEWAGGTERRKHVYFLKYIDYAITVALFFPSFLPPPPSTGIFPSPYMSMSMGHMSSLAFLKTFYFQRGRERGKINVWLPLLHPLLGTGPATGLVPTDWESIRRPFASQSDVQSTEPHQVRAPVLLLTASCLFLYLGIYVNKHT